MRDPDDREPEPPGGRAAERLRQHLQSRFGDTAAGEHGPTADDENEDENENEQRDGAGAAEHSDEHSDQRRASGSGPAARKDHPPDQV